MDKLIEQMLSSDNKGLISNIGRILVYYFRDENSLGVIESLTDYLNAQIEIADFYAEFQLEKEKLMGV